MQTWDQYGTVPVQCAIPTTFNRTSQQGTYPRGAVCEADVRTFDLMVKPGSGSNPLGPQQQIGVAYVWKDYADVLFVSVQLYQNLPYNGKIGQYFHMQIGATDDNPAGSVIVTNSASKMVSSDYSTPYKNMLMHTVGKYHVSSADHCMLARERTCTDCDADASTTYVFACTEI